MDKAPEILLIKTGNTLSPYGRHSAPMLDELVSGQVLTAKPRKGRKPPRNSAYWAGLQQAVKATEAWPTADHLHDDLKRLCGYVEVHHNPLTGLDEVRVQSTAFARMNESEFAAYFTQARREFIERMGFDAWAREDTA